MGKTTEVSFNPKYFEAIKEITKVSNKIAFQQTADKVVVAHQSEGKEVNVFVEAPKEMFNYNHDVGMIDFNNFNTVFKALGENATISIDEIGEGDDAEANLMHVNGDASNVSYGLSTVELMKGGRTVMPGRAETHTSSFTITEEQLKNIKQLTSALIVNGSGTGTKLSILSEKGDTNVKLTFAAHESVGHTFVKDFDSDNADVEVKLVFDPLFFTWLPNNDYIFHVVVADGEVAKVNHIVATGEVKDGDTHICYQNYIAGKLRQEYVG